MKVKHLVTAMHAGGEELDADEIWHLVNFIQSLSKNNCDSGDPVSSHYNTSHANHHD